MIGVSTGTTTGGDGVLVQAEGLSLIRSTDVIAAQTIIR